MGKFIDSLFKEKKEIIILDNKKIIDKELQEYYNKKKEELEKEYIKKSNRDSEKLQTRYYEEDLKFAKQCANQMAEYEHDFHQAKENKRSVLAGIDAQIEERKKFLSILGELIDKKRTENGIPLKNKPLKK